MLVVVMVIVLAFPCVGSVNCEYLTLVSLNRLSVGCVAMLRRQSGVSACRLLNSIRVIYTMLPPHGHWLILP